MSSDDSLEDFGDNNGADGSEDGNDNPFGDKPKFDAGVEADEETDPKKYIEQLSGKLGQSLRSYTDESGQVDSELEKYAINSVISATHPEKMDQEDLNDIKNKLDSKEDSSNDESNNSPSVDNEPSDEENNDDMFENFVLDKEHKQVFQDEKLGLNEQKNRNVEKYLVSLINPKLKKIEMITKTKNDSPVETPVKPMVKPAETPNRRSMPYKPRITPQVNPEPKQKL